MVRRSQPQEPEQLRQQLIELLTCFEQHLHNSDLREQVQALIPAHYLLRDLGSSLLPQEVRLSARDRILAYLREYVGQVVAGDELMVVAGISEYARRIRELRVELGWPILSGNTVRDMQAEADEAMRLDLPNDMGPDDYILQVDQQDREAAHRWHIANEIRKERAGVQDKLLKYFRANVGRPVTSEELRYVAGDKSEWARRTRELRTEEGWPIVTRYNGDPKLPVGVYVLARDEQSPPHDRHIPEITRREVMERDRWSCQWQGCGWNKGRYEVDHRYLEVHHVIQHAHGGLNEADNLVTLCNLHHDQTHKTGEQQFPLSGATPLS